MDSGLFHEKPSEQMGWFGGTPRFIMKHPIKMDDLGR